MNLLNLKTILAKEFPDLGNFIDINPMRFDFNVNNSVSYKTDLGKYIVKEMYVARDFYGIPNPTDRLELISKVTKRLRNAGINIESVKS